MAIETHSISVPIDANGLEFFDALEGYYRSRATKALVSRSTEMDVLYILAIPIINHIRVNSRAFGRALRSLIKGTFDKAAGGDRAVIFFSQGDDSTLTLKVCDHAETGMTPIW